MAERSGPRESRQAAFGLTLALTVLTAFAAFAVLMPIVMAVIKPSPIPEVVGVKLTQRQTAESLLYLAAFGAILPLAVLVGPRVSAAIAAGPNARALSSLLAILAAGLAVAVGLLRLSDESFSVGGSDGQRVRGRLPLGGGGHRGAGPGRPGSSLGRGAEPVRPCSAALGSGRGTGGPLAADGHPRKVDHPPPTRDRRSRGSRVAPPVPVRRLPHLDRRWGSVADVLVLALIVLAAIDLVTISPDKVGGSFLDHYRISVAHFHQDFFMRPANQVLGGQAMLVDTSSQYGVGSIYAVAAWFKLVGIGYGTLGILDGVVTALFFGTGYCVLRVAGASRLLASATLTLGVFALVLDRSYPVGALIQEGPLRFGLPMGVILALVAGARWPARSSLARGVAVASWRSRPSGPSRLSSIPRPPSR